MEWYRQKWACILFLILFPPLGIYWLWKYQADWKKNIRVLLTVVSAIWCFAFVGLAFSSEVLPKSISILKGNIKLGVGETVESKVSLEPLDANFSDAKVLISEEGIVEFYLEKDDEGNYLYRFTGRKEGTATFLVYCGEIQSNKVTIQVIDRERLKKQAAAVEQQIEEIGDVSLRSGEAIASARKAYDALEKDAAILVGNYDTLLLAETTLQDLQDKAWAQADEAKKKIEAIGEVSLESESVIAEARAYYNSLPYAVQPLVENYSELESAEQVFQQKKEEAAKAQEQSNQKPSKTPQTSSGSKEPAKVPDDGGIVYWTPKGKKYHLTKGCRTLARSKTIYSGTISQAGGRDRCAVCG